MDTKICKTCEQEKSLEDFAPSATGKLGRSAHCRLCRAAKNRETYRLNSEYFREYKREQMRRRRADMEINSKINERRRRSYPAKSKQGQKLYREELREKHFFKWRARLWSARHREKITASELFALWHKQHGKCALSGRKLDKDAHLDHIVPISKGGEHGMNNLRWLDPLVNVARGNLSDDEFVQLCRDVCNNW